MESYQLIDETRREIPLYDHFELLPPLPEVFVYGPAMYRRLYESDAVSGVLKTELGKGASAILKALQKQKGYRYQIKGDFQPDILSPKQLGWILQVRGSELRTQSAAIAVRASSQFATTIRLPLGVNRSFGKLRQLATNARSDDVNKRRKFASLFREAQDELAAAVDPRLMERIELAQFGIKLFADAPLEWLPSGDIPLHLRHDVSRIPVTPGNLSIMATTMYPGIGLTADAFHDILHIDASPLGDPAHGKVAECLAYYPTTVADGKLNVVHVEPKNTVEFMDAVNAYNGPMLIVDGHGIHSDDTDVANLQIGSDLVDIWSLRGKIRVPPIVFLSACDTHALDRSHATTANGFLSLGAMSVIPTLLPVRILQGAAFVARFVYRLTDFIPAALKGYGRSLRWSEIFSGMLKLQLASDVILEMTRDGFIPEPLSEGLMMKASESINGSRRIDWYEKMLSDISDATKVDGAVVTARAKKLVGLSDVIRYIHIGNPEHITVAEKFDD